MHKGLIISSSLQPINYLKPLSLCSNFLDTTISFIITEYKAIGCLKTWNLSFIFSWPQYY